jgi:uncharacterized protein YsxB (DUF464 family)
MTTITITKSSDGNYKWIESKGHAGFADAGEDIVCAAISVLMINTMNSVEKFTEDGIVATCDEDRAILRLEFKDTPSHEADLLLKSFELGVNSIFEQYGKKYLNIKFRRE